MKPAEQAKHRLRDALARAARARAQIEDEAAQHAPSCGCVICKAAAGDEASFDTCATYLGEHGRLP